MNDKNSFEKVVKAQILGQFAKNFEAAKERFNKSATFDEKMEVWSKEAGTLLAGLLLSAVLDNNRVLGEKVGKLETELAQATHDKNLLEAQLLNMRTQQQLREVPV